MRYSFQIRPNPYAVNGFHGYITRNNGVSLIVIHTGEIAADILGDDMTAENLSSYMSNTPVQVSWHGTTDSDGIIHNIPHSYTGFHVSGYNSRSVGIEQGIKAAQWKGLPASHRNAMIENLAIVSAWYAQIYDIPVRSVTRAQADAGQKGFAAHATLNPHNRTDPGPDFPVDLFFERVKFHKNHKIIGIGDKGPSVKLAQQHLHELGYKDQAGPADGDAGPKFDDAVRSYEKDNNLSSTGLYTRARIDVPIVITPPPVEPQPDEDKWTISINGEITEVVMDEIFIEIKKSKA